MSVDPFTSLQPTYQAWFPVVCLPWLCFGVEQQEDTGEWAVRGCIAPDGINAITTQPDKLYMAGVDGSADLASALKEAFGDDAPLCMAKVDWQSVFLPNAFACIQLSASLRGSVEPYFRRRNVPAIAGGIRRLGCSIPISKGVTHQPSSHFRFVLCFSCPTY